MYPLQDEGLNMTCPFHTVPTLLLHHHHSVTFQFECCGVDDWTDFNTTDKWTRERLVNTTIGKLTFISLNKILTNVSSPACVHATLNYMFGIVVSRTKPLRPK